MATSRPVTQSQRKGAYDKLSRLVEELEALPMEIFDRLYARDRHPYKHDLVEAMKKLLARIDV